MDIMAAIDSKKRTSQKLTEKQMATKKKAGYARRLAGEVVKQGTLPITFSMSGAKSRRLERFVVLKKTGLLYWSAAPLTAVECDMRLTGSVRLQIVEDGFKIACGDISLVIHPKSPTECDLWLTAIRYVIQVVANSVQSARSDGPSVSRVYGTTFELISRYEPIQIVGQGTFGLVVSALNTETGEYVAIKKIHDAFADLVDGKRFLRELLLMKHFQHPNLLDLHEILKPVDPLNFNDVYIVTGLMHSNLYRVIKSKQNLTEAHLKCFVYQV